MKTHDTFPGRSYSVHSTAGCTVYDDSGWSKELAAPEDYFTAHGGKVYLSDDSASVKELFKLAPIAFGGGGAGWYDVLKSELRELLGAGNFALSYDWVDGAAVLTYAVSASVNNEQLAQAEALIRRYKPAALLIALKPIPLDYVKLAYIESDKKQIIDTGWTWSSTDEIYVECETLGTPNYNIFGTDEKTRFAATSGSGAYFELEGKQYRFTSVNTARRISASYSPSGLRVNGLFLTGPATEWESERNVLLFNVYGSGYVANMKLFSYEHKTSGGDVQCLVPVVDADGTAGLFDTVNRQSFRNTLTAQFIAGIDAQEQLESLLRRLPDRTGQKVGTLKVRLADNLQTEENRAAMDAVAAKNWEITEP